MSGISLRGDKMFMHMVLIKQRTSDTCYYFVIKINDLPLIQNF